MKQEPVNGAAPNSSATNTTRQDSAGVFVLHVTELQKQRPVYNLEVENVPEFFANGILVHNCADSLRYCISWLTGSGEETRDSLVNVAVPIGPGY